MPPMLQSFLLVALGGALGAVARLAMTLWLSRSIVLVPLGTFASNLIGCFVMGIVVQLLASPGWFSHSELITQQNRLFFAVGFCGSFTTLSALVVEMSNLMQRGEVLPAFAYLCATMIGGFACFYAGAALIRSVVQTQGG
ncbi:MAG: CrcB family protein [Gammaproteobacteria bacterium]|nr:CrcB family protein [Gammaproteobacteria bacterium]